jgi:hypothetical protein
VGILRNSEVGPGDWHLDMTFTKDYQLGPEVAGGGGEDDDRDRGGGGWEGGGGGEGGFDGRRIRFQARLQNLFNRVQPRAYGNVVTSPLFGADWLRGWPSDHALPECRLLTSRLLRTAFASPT